MANPEAPKIRETKLGEWMRKNAPEVLEKVGDVLPDSGALGIVKNLLGSNPEAQKLINELEKGSQEAVTRRWEADMGSDTKLAKMVRPMALISLLGLYLVLVLLDSAAGIAFEVRESYIQLLETLSLTAFGAYFAGRTIEKARK
jgi:hypothetical protein